MGKLALITGASSGIGKELARLHASKGGDLLLVARSKDKLKELKQELEEKYSIKAYVLSCDLSDLTNIPTLFEEVKKLLEGDI